MPADPPRTLRVSRTKRARPGTYHHGDLPRALADASLKLLEKHGVEGFSLREAATACGVAVSAAYKHYDSKGALLHAVADRGFSALADRMTELREAASEGLDGVARIEARLVAVGRAYILFALEHRNLFRLMFGPFGLKGGRGDPRPDAPAHRLSSLLREALQEVSRVYGHAADEVEPDKLIAWASVHGFSTMVVDGVWVPPSPEALEAMIAELGRSVLRSLR